MDIRKMYQDKLVSASEAAKTVKSGDWVDYAWTTSTPVAVICIVLAKKWYGKDWFEMAMGAYGQCTGSLAT